MEVILAAIPGVGAIAMLVFLIRNALKAPRMIATAQFPSYMRMNYWMSFAACLSLILPWGFAAFNSDDFPLWLSLVVSPVIFGLVLMHLSKKLMERQSPEAKEYFLELAKDSRTMRFIRSIPSNGIKPPLDLE